MNQTEQKKKSHDPNNFVREAIQAIKFCIDAETLLPKNIKFVVESIGLTCQYIIWGDKNDNGFFEQSLKLDESYYCDQGGLALFGKLLTKHQNRDIQIQIMKTIAMFLFNLSNIQNINYVLSQPQLNVIINHEYNFQDDEIIAFYINMLKSISLRITSDNIQLFFNNKYSEFPLLMRVIQFYNHKENMVRTSVRNVVLAITNSRPFNQIIINYPPLRAYVRNFPFILFFVQFICSMKDNLQQINTLLIHNKPENSNLVRLMVDDQLDSIMFLEDLVKINEDSKNVIVNSIHSYGTLASIFPSLLPEEVFQMSEYKKPTQLNLKLCFYLLIQFFKTFNQPDILDLTLLILAGRIETIPQFIQRQNIINNLYTYSPNPAMSTVWLKEKKFILAFSQEIFKLSTLKGQLRNGGVQEIKIDKISRMIDIDSLATNIEGNTDYGKFQLMEELQSICQILGVQYMTSSLQEEDQYVNPLKYLSNLREQIAEGKLNLLDVEEENFSKTILHSIIQSLRSNDDTIVYLTLMLIRFIRHSKFISKDILATVGMLTIDKDEDLYNSPTNQYIRTIMMPLFLRILGLGCPPFRLGSLIVAAQLLMDFARVTKETYQISDELKKKFIEIYRNQLITIKQYFSDPTNMNLFLDFFLNEFRSQNTNPIQSWLSVDHKLLFPISLDGESQLDANQPDNFLFKQPVTFKDIFRRDLMILMILKHLSMYLIGNNHLTEAEIELMHSTNPLRPNWKYNYQPEREYHLGITQKYKGLLDGKRKMFECKFTTKESSQECVVIEDEYNLVIVYPFSSPEKVKVFKVFNIKNTDEQLNKQDNSQVMVTVLQKVQIIKFIQNGNTFCFNLNFNSRLVALEFKRILDDTKLALSKSEDQIMKKYLDVLEKQIPH